MSSSDLLSQVSAVWHVAVEERSSLPDLRFGSGASPAAKASTEDSSRRPSTEAHHSSHVNFGTMKLVAFVSSRVLLRTTRNKGHQLHRPEVDVGRMVGFGRG